jgi:hypothetical protein
MNNLIKIFLLTTCLSFFPPIRSAEVENNLVDLNATTEIILAAIKQPSELLEENFNTGLDFLLKNFSIADLALEADVLSSDLPVLLFFYKDPLERDTIDSYGRFLLGHFNQKIKVVIVNAEILFKLAEKTEIFGFPAALVVHERQEKNRLEGHFDEQDLVKLIESGLSEQHEEDLFLVEGAGENFE